jgi:hypothetical protein
MVKGVQSAWRCCWLEPRPGGSVAWSWAAA